MKLRRKRISLSLKRSASKGYGSKLMKKIIHVALSTLLFALSFLGAMSLVFGPSVEAQQLKKVPRIGYLTVTSPSASAPNSEAFREGLRQLGYIEGQNILI